MTSAQSNSARETRCLPSVLAFDGIAPPGVDDFERDVVEGLSQNVAEIPCKYLYDAEGSRLFDAICELPEYYPTRTELALTRRCAPELARAIGPDAVVIEPGAGSTTKIRLLLDALERAALYAPVDISGDHLRSSAAQLAPDYPQLEVLPIAADFTRPFEVALPAGFDGPRVVYFPGSTIGNFEPAEAERLLRSFAGPLRAGDLVLLGWDRVKDERILVPAYADASGTTQAFIRNLLHRLRRELDAVVNPDAFALDTRWQPERERIRISLRSIRDQAITLAGRRFDFPSGRELFVEHSHKYSETSMARLCRAAGLELAKTWTDDDRLFSLSLLKVRPRS